MKAVPNQCGIGECLRYAGFIRFAHIGTEEHYGVRIPSLDDEMTFEELQNILAMTLADEDDIVLLIEEDGDIVLAATELRLIDEDAGNVRQVLFRNRLADDIIEYPIHGAPIQIEFCSNSRFGFPLQRCHDGFRQLSGVSLPLIGSREPHTGLATAFLTVELRYVHQEFAVESLVGHVMECSRVVAYGFGQLTAARTPVGVLAIL